MAPLGEQEVHDIEVLAPGHGVAPLCREEVNVRVAAEPAPGVHVAPALESQRQLLLTRRDRCPRAERLVLEAAGHVDQQLAARQPALARAIDVGVADASEPDVSCNGYLEYPFEKMTISSFPPISILAKWNLMKEDAREFFSSLQRNSLNATRKPHVFLLKTLREAMREIH